jgi:hypothetical protein
MRERGVSKGTVSRPEIRQPGGQRFPPQGGGGRRHLLRSRHTPADPARKRAGVVRGRPPAGLLVPAHGAGQEKKKELPLKTCSRCGLSKPYSEFYRDMGHRDGLTSDCRSCRRSQAVAWQKAHPEKAREMKRRHRVKRWAAAQGGQNREVLFANERRERS